MLTIDILEIMKYVLFAAALIFAVYIALYIIYRMCVWIYAHFINDVANKIQELNKDNNDSMSNKDN